MAGLSVAYLAGQACKQARRVGRPDFQACQARRQASQARQGRQGRQDRAGRAGQAERTENDGKMATKSIGFLNFSASGAAGVHFERPAGARRLQKAG